MTEPKELNSMANDPAVPEQFKACKNCSLKKPINGGFYVVGKTKRVHANCRKCYNKSRMKYKRKAYKKVKTGFSKLPDEIQKAILYDIKAGIKYKKIAEKYQAAGVKYTTLMLWKRKGLITLAN